MSNQDKCNAKDTHSDLVRDKCVGNQDKCNAKIDQEEVTHSEVVQEEVTHAEDKLKDNQDHFSKSGEGQDRNLMYVLSEAQRKLKLTRSSKSNDRSKSVKSKSKSKAKVVPPGRKPSVTAKQIKFGVKHENSNHDIRTFFAPQSEQLCLRGKVNGRVERLNTQNPQE